MNECLTTVLKCVLTMVKVEMWCLCGQVLTVTHESYKESLFDKDDEVGIFFFCLFFFLVMLLLSRSLLIKLFFVSLFLNKERRPKIKDQN